MTLPNFYLIVSTFVSVLLTPSHAAVETPECFSLRPYFPFSSVIGRSNGTCEDVCESLQCTMYLSSITSRACLFSKLPIVLFKELNIPYCGADKETLGEDILVFNDKFKFHKMRMPVEFGDLVDYYPQVIVMDHDNYEVYKKVVKSEQLVNASPSHKMGQYGYFRYPMVYTEPKSISIFGNLVAFWLMENSHFRAPISVDSVNDFTLRNSRETVISFKLNQTHCEISCQYPDSSINQIVPLDKDPKISQNAWHHIAIKENSSRSRLVIFIDGIQTELNGQDETLNLSTLTFVTGVAHVNIWQNDEEVPEMILFLARHSLP